MRIAEERYQVLDASWTRWHATLSPHLLRCLRRNALTVEEAALMADAALLQLPGFGRTSLRELRSVA